MVTLSFAAVLPAITTASAASPGESQNIDGNGSYLRFQVGGFGPSLGQAHHFRQYAPEKIQYGIDRYTNEVNRLYGVMNRRLADRRIYPAIDIQRTSTRKEELLMDKDELNRVYLLRNFLADMPPVEALEFLLERMKRTKNNKEFFATMAQ